MELSFERGSAERPRGHAVVYFRDPADPDTVGATYVIVLPLVVDIGKYMPPFLAGQVPNLAEAGLSAFAFPPAPEPAGSYDDVVAIAEARDDDLIFGGSRPLSDVTGLLTVIGEIVEAYSTRYEEAAGAARPGAGNLDELDAAGQGGRAADDVDDVVYGLMSEADRLGELTKLVGRLRYATEGNDEATSADANAHARALARHMPANRRIDLLLAAAVNRAPEGARLAELYLERAYCLLREDYLRVKALDEQIAGHDAPLG